MQIQQPRYFIAAAENRSFRAAAQKPYIAQPSVSAAAGDLEREAGVTLFERIRSGVSLTPEGVDFLRHARAVVEQVDLMEARFSKSNATRARLAVSSGSGETSSRCRKRLRVFQHSGPGRRARL